MKFINPFKYTISILLLFLRSLSVYADPPTDITLTPSTVAENQSAGTVVGTLTTTDPDVGDTFMYFFATGGGDDDNSSFDISGDQLLTDEIFNYETKNSYTVLIRSYDQTFLWVDIQITITITNVNEAPVINSNGGGSSASVNILENTTAVTTVTSTDVDFPTTPTYSITGGTDQSSFSIIPSTGVLTFITAPDFENPTDANTNNSYNVQVTVTDDGVPALTDMQSIAVTVQNQNETPTDITLSSSTIAENLPTNTVVGTFTTTDPDASGTFTYTKATGEGDVDNGSFNISGNQLRINAPFDFETKSSYSIRIRSTDQGSLFVEKQFTITVTDVNEAPTNITLFPTSIEENQPINTVVGTFTTTDPDNDLVFTYTLVGGAGSTDNASFNILGDQLRSSVIFDLETKPSYSIRVRSTDAGLLFFEKQFTITITDINDRPDLAGIETTILQYTEDDPGRVITSTITVTDPDDANLASARVFFSQGFVNTEDSLYLVSAIFTVNYNMTTGILDITGNRTLAEYRTALRNVRYCNTDTLTPQTNDRVVSFVVNDGIDYSDTLSRTIHINLTNDAPVLSNIETTPLAYTENAAPTQITNTIQVVDYDDTQLESGTVRITSGYQNGQDTLIFTNANGITGTWNQTLGSMSLAGTSLVANYRSALRNVRYANTSENPSPVTRVISFTVNDGNVSSNTVTRNLTVTPQNDPPVASEAAINGTHTPFHTRELLTAAYLYTDPENNPESGTTFKWFTANTSGGAGRTQITGAVSDTFTTRFADGGKYISMVVIPRDLPGLIGDDDTSAWYYINAAPELQDLIVVNRLHPGAIAVGETVSADYEYYDFESNPSGAHEFQWYRSNTGSWASASIISGQDDSTYTIQPTDNNRYIAIETYPHATTGSSPGERTRSSWYAVGTLPTAVISGNDSICNAGMNAELLVTLTGENPPWAFKYTRNGANETEVTGITQPNYTLTVTQVGTYVLTEVSDEKFTHGNVSGTGTVSLHTLPTAVFTEGTTACEALQNKLNITLTGKSPWTVTYRYESGSPVTVPNIPSSPYNIPVANLGDYTLISVSDANCPNTATGTIEIIPAPEVAILDLDTIYPQTELKVPFHVDPEGGSFIESDLNTVFVINDTLIFSPSFAGTANSPHMVRYSYTDPGTGCIGKDSLNIYVLEDVGSISVYGEEEPKARYCFNEGTIHIVGVNLDYSIGSFSISGSPDALINIGNNEALLIPSLVLTGTNLTGTRTVYYDFIFNGLPQQVSREFLFEKIEGDFSWDNECFGDESIVTFRDTSTGGSALDSFAWKIQYGEEIITRSGKQTTMTFEELSVYPIELVVMSEYQCTDTVRKDLILKPTFTVNGTPVLEDFQDGQSLWYSFSEDEDGLNSWTFGRPNEGVFAADPGENAWYTHIVSLNAAENSFVISPCFDFSAAQRPMIKMDLWRGFIDAQDQDGAVLQYTIDNGENWEEVGTSVGNGIGDGIDWYNSFSIDGNPGGQEVGWTDYQDDDWVEVRHKLDDLLGKTNVRFRLAYGAPGQITLERDGIAFDDFWIGERSKKVLIEHFTNAGNADSKDADEALNAILNQDENRYDIIDIQYHVGQPGPDPFYDLNPGHPESRKQYYGLSSIPYSIIDGGRGDDPDFLINYSSDEHLNQNDLTIAALEDNVFTLNIQALKGDNSVDIDIELVSLEDLGQKYLTLHTVIIENLVTEVTGENGETNFESVMKTMLPNSIGTIYNRSWSVGTKEEISLHYDYKDVFNEKELRVVVFVQDEETKTVYQAVIHNPNLPSGVDPYTGRETHFTVFPNPASSSVYIKLDRFEAYDLNVEVLNSEGRIIFIQKIQQGEDIFEVPLQSLEAGLYFVRLTTREQILGTEKLIYLGNK